MIKIKRGLDIPISGAPNQSIEDGRAARSLALVGYDYVGLKPTMAVAAGDSVKKGQLLFTDKKTPGIKYTAPASGVVRAINRGKKRLFQSLVIDVDQDKNTAASDNEITFNVANPAALGRDDLVNLLVDAGEWVSLRTRPFDKVPAPASIPADIFVTALDTRPLAPAPALFLHEHSAAFQTGLEVMAKLTAGRVFVCTTPEANLAVPATGNIQLKTFTGKHPAGLVGTHIHFLSPVSQNKTVWHLGYQNLVAIGYLFQTGKIFVERMISIAGPGIENPRIIRTRVGASLDELTAGELRPGEQRIISGSVLDGRTATGALAYLGRYHNQVSVLQEGTRRIFLGFVMPGLERFSLTRIFASTFLAGKKYAMTTNTGGSPRAMVPLGTYEEVMPLDILPTQLLRALLVGDFDTSIALGCLELAEEDLSLCTFACPGKYEYGPYLRDILTRIEAEG